MASSNDSPFLYPKARHSRRLKPPPYKTYKSFKPHLRKEFRQKCIYCRRPDSFCPHDSDAFAVEHYLPKEDFPEKACDYSNLFYACLKCNSFKGRYYAATPTEPFVPNPCDHVMFSHMQLNDGVVVAATRHGAFAIDLLRLNDSNVVDFRKMLARLIRRAVNEIKENRQLEKRVRKRARETECDASADIAVLKALRSENEELLAHLCGNTLQLVETSELVTTKSSK